MCKTLIEPLAVMLMLIDPLAGKRAGRSQKKELFIPNSSFYIVKSLKDPLN